MPLHLKSGDHLLHLADEWLTTADPAHASQFRTRAEAESAVAKIHRVRPRMGVDIVSDDPWYDALCSPHVPVEDQDAELGQSYERGRR
jgi:hypothetical protein